MPPWFLHKVGEPSKWGRVKKTEGMKEWKKREPQPRGKEREKDRKRVEEKGVEKRRRKRKSRRVGRETEKGEKKRDGENERRKEVTGRKEIERESILLVRTLFSFMGVPPVNYKDLKDPLSKHHHTGDIGFNIGILNEQKHLIHGKLK